MFKMVALLTVVSLFVSTGVPEEPPYKKASLIQLIGTPERFEGKNVSVVGVLLIELEGATLFLTPQDANNRIYVNSVAVRLDESRVRPKKNPAIVHINGRFRGRLKGNWRWDLSRTSP
jgi:hypothetical protein